MDLKVIGLLGLALAGFFYASNKTKRTHDTRGEVPLNWEYRGGNDTMTGARRGFFWAISRTYIPGTSYENQGDEVFDWQLKKLITGEVVAGGRAETYAEARAVMLATIEEHLK